MSTDYDAATIAVRVNRDAVEPSVVADWSCPACGEIVSRRQTVRLGDRVSDAAGDAVRVLWLRVIEHKAAHAREAKR